MVTLWCAGSGPLWSASTTSSVSACCSLWRGLPACPTKASLHCGDPTAWGASASRSGAKSHHCPGMTPSLLWPALVFLFPNIKDMVWLNSEQAVKLWPADLISNKTFPLRTMNSLKWSFKTHWCQLLKCERSLFFWKLSSLKVEWQSLLVVWINCGYREITCIKPSTFCLSDKLLQLEFDPNQLRWGHYVSSNTDGVMFHI